jgi:hypothetical protein
MRFIIKHGEFRASAADLDVFSFDKTWCGIEAASADAAIEAVRWRADPSYPLRRYDRVAPNGARFLSFGESRLVGILPLDLAERLEEAHGKAQEIQEEIRDLESAIEAATQAAPEDDAGADDDRDPEPAPPRDGLPLSECKAVLS